jgi:hypothetical protein
MKKTYEQNPNFRLEKRDGMPREVAAELLATSGTHLSNTVRKNCLDAMSKHWVSTLERKPLEAKLPKKFAAATGAQLTKWSRRVVARRKQVQAAYEFCVAELAKEGIKRRQQLWFERQKAALDFTASQLDAVRDALEYEIDTRNVSTPRWQAEGLKNPAIQHPNSAN